MNGDPLAPVRPNDPFPSAATFNALFDAARGVRAGRFDPRPNPKGVQQEHRLVVSVKNGGSTLAPLAIVRATGTPLDLTTVEGLYNAERSPTITVGAPAADTDHPLVLLDGIESNGYGRAVIMGVAGCTVDIDDTAHTHAGCVASDTAKLTSRSTGPVRILAKESAGTGNKRCLVLIGAAPQRTALKGKLDGTLSFGSSATMSVWEHNGSAEADTTENVTVYDWLLSSGQTVASAKQVVGLWIGNRWYAIGAQCS